MEDAPETLFQNSEEMAGTINPVREDDGVRLEKRTPGHLRVNQNRCPRSKSSQSSQNLDSRTFFSKRTETTEERGPGKVAWLVDPQTPA